MKLNPNDANAFYLRAMLYDDSGQPERALEDYNHAIQLNANDYWLFYGMSYIAARRFDHAIQDYTQALKLKPNDPEALKLRAIAYYKKGQYDLAIQACNRVITSNPKNGAAFIVRGSANKKKGDIRGGDADPARGQLLRGTTPVQVK